MLTTKIKNKILNGKFIDLNSKVSFIDLNISHIAEYILKSECYKFRELHKVGTEKILLLNNLKTQLNLKKLKYIELLQNDFKMAYNGNIANSFNLHGLIANNSQCVNNDVLSMNKNKVLKFCIKYKLISIKQFLKSLPDNDIIKICQKTDNVFNQEITETNILFLRHEIIKILCDNKIITKNNIGKYINLDTLKLPFDFMEQLEKYKDYLSYCFNIEHDINKIEIVINQFKEYLKTSFKINPFNYGNVHSKINNKDIDLLNNGIVSRHIKEAVYFYLIKTKKANKTTNVYNNNLIWKMQNNLINDQEIQQLININQDNTYLNSIDKSITIKSNNFIEFIKNKWF